MSLAHLRTTENAFAQLALSASLSQSLGLNVYTGIDNLEKVAPLCVCYAESATEEFPYSGVYHVKMHVNVKEMAADTDVNTGSVAANIFQTFLNDNNDAVKNQLSTYPGYFVYGYFHPEPYDRWQGDAHIQGYSFEVVCGLVG